jgi:serine/threonine-protein kinase
MIDPAADTGQVIGRYVVYEEIAAGGMASVHLGRLKGAVGFSRTVAIKRLHAHLARDEEFTGMFLDEARLAARIRHPNVVAVLDVVHDAGELFLVMDYVQGEPLSRLMRAIRPGAITPRIAVTVMSGVLHGLHAAHEATTEHGEPLEIVHRDVSPQNVLVGTDGVARVFDFGVAKATHRTQATQDGSVKGKISYMAPEQLLSEVVDRRADVYAAAVMLWEALAGERLFDGENQGRTVRMILDEPVPPPSTIVVGLPKALDEAVMRGLDRDVSRRWQTARDFAAALERCVPPAPATEVGEWVESLGGPALGYRARRVKDIESRSDIFAANEVLDPKEATAETVLEPKIGPATVPAAFAVMATEPADMPIVPSSRPAPFDDVPPPVPPSSRSLRAAAAAARGPSVSSAKVPISPQLASLSVQTVAVTPLASLEEAAAARRRGGRRMLALGIVLAILGVLAVAGAVTWTLLHR